MSASVTPEPPASSTTWEQFHEAGRRRFAEGDAVGAEQAFRAAIARAEQPGSDPLQLASSLSSLGQLKYQQKENAVAEECFRRSLELREGVLGAEHPTVIGGINNLAALYVARGALDEAEPLLQRAMAVTVRRVESTQAELAVNLNNLVRLYVKRGDYAAAEPLLLRLLALKRPLGPEHPDVAAVIVTLAKLRQSMGQPEAAERLWRRVLVVRQRMLPANDLVLASTLDGLAEACAAQGKADQELGLRERALAIREATPGGDDDVLQPLRARIAALKRGIGAPRAAANAATPSGGANGSSPASDDPAPGPVPTPSASTTLAVESARPARTEGRTDPARVRSPSPSSAPVPEIRHPTPIPEIESISPDREAAALAAARQGPGAAGTPSAVNWIEPSTVVAPLPSERVRVSDERPRPKFKIPEQARRTERPRFIGWVIAAVALAAAAAGFLYLRGYGDSDAPSTAAITHRSPGKPSDPSAAGRGGPSEAPPVVSPTEAPAPAGQGGGPGSERPNGTAVDAAPSRAPEQSPAPSPGASQPIPTARQEHLAPAPATPVRAVATRATRPPEARRPPRTADTAAEVPNINLDAAVKAADQAAVAKP
jgi:tetratricopeptide (TPR) repeat protein